MTRSLRASSTLRIRIAVLILLCTFNAIIWGTAGKWELSLDALWGPALCLLLGVAFALNVLFGDRTSALDRSSGAPRSR